MFKKIVVGLSLAIMLGSATFTGSQAEAASYHTKAIKVAKSELGTKYKMGGISSSGFDCSGLVKYSYQKAGKNLPRTAADIYKKGKSVKTLQKGDLMFFAPNKAKKPTHVAIYIGDNQFIHSASSKGVSYAQTNNPYWKPKYIGAKRL
ncbi:C40 family peptidase [Bacillus sp. mrc49]|uniref:C40 family peptidase n=1 Tax=Bacillus sp. mrc49 TaxID=2054913 RepID=UPI00268584F7